jgi:hypothetical protein
MAEIKIPEPKYKSAERKSIDTITIRDNKVIVRERSLRKHGRLFVHGYDPLQHAVSDVWGR